MNPLVPNSRQQERQLNFLHSGNEDEGGVDPKDWDPTDPSKKRVKKVQRRYSFEQPSSSSTKKGQSGRKQYVQQRLHYNPSQQNILNNVSSGEARGNI
ncbi:hypothetical protein FGO68_gene297 [Halteria grandinella]|uniref:Uncharacterized protein n=1 Tax=Halteria grandinella TaxID=5974 RepID=A0A8J8NVN0_HALGN|nr:hypothetical protein FGO68_gene297 [Halteria grandinella]